MTARKQPQEFPWAGRWRQVARAAGLRETDPVAVALSGGADSVLLLHLVARSEPRPRILAVHVDHGLRGDESDGDSAFCARLCGRLGVPFARRFVELDGDGPNLEARAREARYRALADEGRAAGIRYLLTGHHEDDALETLLLRWTRGSALPGLPGLRQRNVLSGDDPSKVVVVRPLLSMRREEVRRILRDHGIEWREDSSNESPRFTRNRVRHRLLPSIEEACGADGLENLRAFASAVETFEDELAARTAHLSWRPPTHAAARRSVGDAFVGGSLDRRAVEALAAPLLRRALWRLVREGTGEAPSRALLAILEDDLVHGRRARRSLPGGWTLHLRRDSLHLTPPGASLADAPRVPVPLEREPDPQLDLPYGRGGTPEPKRGLELSIPGIARLPDGRTISAEVVRVSGTRSAPRSPVEVELDAVDLPEGLSVRWARPGDRFHGLGAPGSRRLSRFLADADVPREERGRIPLVFAGDELIWVAGIRPCEARRVRPGVERRLRLRLEGAAPARTPEAPVGELFDPAPRP